MKTIEWTKPKLERFRKAREKAVAAKKESFAFDHHVFLCDYAKYLIEYLDLVFKKSKP